LNVVAEAADGLEALAKARELSPHVVLLDVEMPNLNGLSAAEVLRRENPSMGIVILSAHMLGQDALRSMRASACGYVSKAASASQLAQAVEVAAAGRGHQSRATQAGLQQLAQRIANRVCCEDLDVPERQVLVAIVEGLRNKEIAATLGIEKRTVETHRERIMRKLNIRSVAGLTRLAVAEGLVPLQ
jgi:two-component system, NarL family, nitrate/nitrite response regulator NarL